MSCQNVTEEDEVRGSMHLIKCKNEMPYRIVQLSAFDFFGHVPSLSIIPFDHAAFLELPGDEPAEH